MSMYVPFDARTIAFPLNIYFSSDSTIYYEEPNLLLDNLNCDISVAVVFFID
jgi:hypothetical protein